MIGFIQLPPAAGHLDPDIDYRRGFERWARRSGSPTHDAVVVYTIDAMEVDGLRDVWRDWVNVDVRVAHPCMDGTHRQTVEAFEVLGEKVRAVSLDAFDARRWSPSQEPNRVTLSCDDIDLVVANNRAVGAKTHLCVDLRVPEQRHVTSLSGDMVELCAVVADVPDSQVRTVVEELKEAGLRRAGRPFGIAGSSIVLRRASSPKAWLVGALGETRVRGGVAIDRWRASTTRVDHSVVPPLDQVSRAEVETTLVQVRRSPEISWNIPVPDGDIDSLAHEAHDRFGVWPISFSYPAMLPLVTPTQQLSPIIPGFPYAFSDNSAYLAAYARASMALTFRKAGWDCFRHLEILASGALPLMPDAERIPRYAMIHYPRSAMAALAAQAMTLGGVPDAQTRRDFRAFAERHLTTQAMARYLLDMSGLEDVQRLLFIDDQTPVNPEYLSTLTLIGLKQLLGRGCEVAFPASFLYTDSTQDTSGFYGRGFGYLHVVAPDRRSAEEEAGFAGQGLDTLPDYDAVVIGSVSRNIALTRMVLEQCDPSRVILIHGEDGPPPTTELAELNGTGAHAFVRALHPTR